MCTMHPLMLLDMHCIYQVFPPRRSPHHRSAMVDQSLLTLSISCMRLLDVPFHLAYELISLVEWKLQSSVTWGYRRSVTLQHGCHTHPNTLLPDGCLIFLLHSLCSQLVGQRSGCITFGWPFMVIPFEIVLGVHLCSPQGRALLPM